MPMKIDKPKCPRCKEHAEGTVEQLMGRADLNFDEDTGLADYAGNTDVWWNEQRPVTSPNGRYRLICPNAHEWWSRCTEVSE